jgi:hypothetical protein
MMYFDDLVFCHPISAILTSKIGRSLKDIGDLDLSHHCEDGIRPVLIFRNPIT